MDNVLILDCPDALSENGGRLVLQIETDVLSVLAESPNDSVHVNLSRSQKRELLQWLLADALHGESVLKMEPTEPDPIEKLREAQAEMTVVLDKVVAVLEKLTDRRPS